MVQGRGRDGHSYFWGEILVLMAPSKIIFELFFTRPKGEAPLKIFVFSTYFGGNNERNTTQQTHIDQRLHRPLQMVQLHRVLARLHVLGVPAEHVRAAELRALRQRGGARRAVRRRRTNKGDRGRAARKRWRRRRRRRIAAGAGPIQLLLLNLLSMMMVRRGRRLNIKLHFLQPPVSRRLLLLHILRSYAI